MPHPIPNDRLIPFALNYLSCRQIQNRPTTVRQFSKHVGLGSGRLTGLLEREKVQFVLIPYAGKKLHGNIEIILISLPDELAENLRIDNEQLFDSYITLLANAQAVEPEEFIPTTEDTPDGDLTPQEIMDPYIYYRINERQFKALKDQLIDVKELYRVAIESGYTYRSIYRATGGPKMRYMFPSQLWRPYIYNHTKYFLKEVLKYLHESDKSYKNSRTAAIKRHRRKSRQRELGQKDYLDR